MRAKHSKCLNGENCTGPGCSVTNYHVNTSAPRRKTRPTKGERRLAARIAAFESGPKSLKHQHHKPGSKKK